MPQQNNIKSVLLKNTLDHAPYAKKVAIGLNSGKHYWLAKRFSKK